MFKVDSGEFICNAIQLSTFDEVDTGACWTLYHDFTISCQLIHLWRHLFTSETLFEAYIKFYHTTSHMVLANEKQEIVEAFNK